MTSRFSFRVRIRSRRLRTQILAAVLHPRAKQLTVVLAHDVDPYAEWRDHGGEA